MMPEDKRHRRECDALLKQIKGMQQDAARKWRLDVPLGKLALQGIGVFVIGILVGLGLYVLFDVFRAGIFG